MISSSRYHPALRIWSMFRFCAERRDGEPDSRSWAKPRIALSGVRNSWLMLERNSDFALIGLFRRGHGRVQLRFDALAHRIVGADQQVSDDVAVVVAQRRDRHDGRKAAAVLADIGQFVDVLDLARSFECQCLEAGRNRGRELEAQRLGARPHFLRIMNVARADPVDDLGGRVAQHALGADIEQLDDALLVGGDDREVGAGQDRVLQRPGLQQCIAPSASTARAASSASPAGAGSVPFSGIWLAMISLMLRRSVCAAYIRLSMSHCSVRPCRRRALLPYMSHASKSPITHPTPPAPTPTPLASS